MVSKLTLNFINFKCLIYINYAIAIGGSSSSSSPLLLFYSSIASHTCQFVAPADYHPFINCNAINDLYNASLTLKKFCSFCVFLFCDFFAQPRETQRQELSRAETLCPSQAIWHNYLFD